MMIYRVLTRKTPYEPKPRSEDHVTDIQSDRLIQRMGFKSEKCLFEILLGFPGCKISRTLFMGQIIESGYMIAQQWLAQVLAPFHLYWLGQNPSLWRCEFCN
ncbi:hypothetical protein AVEN_17442-1 [Araneus ventricosus]|uniref:Uncharacterized protein n=1 Tax=Araneus ventricosus TaxID=182803 RepID=A0A4Y2GXZ6_ARAVE|nr:hypothetical protein AVEN_17442-1 [Araneus ventricosus]